MKAEHWNKIKEIGWACLAFLLPLILLIIMMSVNNVALFSYSGDTIMMIDMKSEYICYMRDLRNILLHGGSFIYTNEKVFGGDYLSIYTFYLASPFNFFVVFFQEEAIPLFFVWSSIIKMAFAGLNFYFLVRFTGEFTFQKIIPAVGYALISYSFIYMSNYMWLDGVMILPLVILGIHFLKEKKFLWLYPLALAYSLMTSWYIGFMICIFAALYFLAFYGASFEKKSKELYLFPIRFALFSLLGGFLSATYWLTAFLHLSGTKGFSDLPKNYNFSVSMILSGFMENNYSTHDLITQYHSYISMFVGIVPLVFTITFFFNKEYKYRDRFAYLALLLFYLIWSYNSVLTALLHGGKEPTWFPGRYSFVIGFLVCYLASRSLDKAEKLHPAFYAAPTVLGIGALLIVAFTTHSERLERYPISVGSVVMYFVTIGFAALISFLHLYPIKKFKIDKISKYVPYFLGLLVIVQVFSVYRAGSNVLQVNAAENQVQPYEVYLKDCAYDSSFQMIKKYEAEHDNAPFYRMEATFNRPGNYNDIDNNPMAYSYAGLSNFSSSSKKNVESYMSKIGFHYNYYFAKYDGGSTYAINSLLGIKYLLEDKSNSLNIHPYFLDHGAFEKLPFNDGNVDFYFNPNAVNFAFSSDKSSVDYVGEGRRLSDSYVYWYDKFEYQNSIFHTLDHSIGQDIFTKLTINSISTTLNYADDIGGIRTYYNVKSGDTITVRFSVPAEAYDFPLYFSEKDYKDGVNYYIDGKLMRVNTYWHKGIYSFPDNTSHNHTLTIRFTKAMGGITLRPELYYENLNVTRAYLASAKSQEVVLDSVSNSMTKKTYTGRLNIVNPNKELIFTLPYEKGIHVQVDGKEVEAYTRYNIFTAIDLSSFAAGEHSVSIYYQDGDLIVALPLFFASAALIVPACIFYNKLEQKIFFRKKKEEETKEPESKEAEAEANEAK